MAQRTAAAQGASSPDAVQRPASALAQSLRDNPDGWVEWTGAAKMGWPTNGGTERMDMGGVLAVRLNTVQHSLRAFTCRVALARILLYAVSGRLACGALAARTGPQRSRRSDPAARHI